MDYLERAADRMLRDRLDGFGAVLIEGPKWCGKTTTELGLHSPWRTLSSWLAAADGQLP